MSTRWKKWVNMYCVFLVICFFSLGILKILLPKGGIAENIINIGILVFICLFLVSIAGGIGISIIYYFKKCIENSHSCRDKLFDELDSYHRCWGETKEHYYDMINVLHFYYKDGGKVDQIVGNDLKRLYKRLEFLEREMKTKDYLITCVASVGLSICATVIFEGVLGSLIEQEWSMLLFGIIFFAVVFFKDSDLFILGSNQIEVYEMKLLKEKIKHVENEIRIDIECEDILLTKKNILNELMDRAFWKAGKKREDIAEDIRSIEKLNLNIQDTSKTKKLTFSIGKKEKRIVLFLDENSNWVSNEYKILYEKLRKYDLICEVDCAGEEI